jgi:hypothetical protein
MTRKQNPKTYRQRQAGRTRDRVVNELRKETAKLERELKEIQKARMEAVMMRSNINRDEYGPSILWACLTTLLSVVRGNRSGPSYR